MVPCFHVNCVLSEIMTSSVSATSLSPYSCIYLAWVVCECLGKHFSVCFCGNLIVPPHSSAQILKRHQCCYVHPTDFILNCFKKKKFLSKCEQGLLISRTSLNGTRLFFFLNIPEQKSIQSNMNILYIYI